MVIDGTQLLELPARQRSAVLELPRVLVCTGIMLSSLPMDLVSGGPGVAVLAKPFCVEDLEAAVEWLRGMPGAPMPSPLPFAALVQRRRPRRPGGRLPAR
jgi:DNA-binding transcriptional LysR family regulator